jgi:scyllo-inositol 2-dehydrogenase (NADP+)
LIRRQPDLQLHGVVARDPRVRAEAVAPWGEAVRGYADLDEALADPVVELVVIATPHDTHAELVVRTLNASKHCVVDKVMALTTTEADQMIAARDRSGCMLSVFHNRRWDWDFATVQEVLNRGWIGRPQIIESAVWRFAPPRAWRGRAQAAGTILYDWGAHLVDQSLRMGLGPCQRLTAWLTPAPWDGVDTGGHGRILMEFKDVLFQIETSRICRLDRPRWWIVGTDGGFVKYGVDPQEDALRGGDIDKAAEPPAHQGVLTQARVDGKSMERRVDTVRKHWDAYYKNIADCLLGRESLAVTAEQAREVVRVLEAATQSTEEHTTIHGLWGNS